MLAVRAESRVPCNSVRYGTRRRYRLVCPDFVRSRSARIVAARALRLGDTCLVPECSSRGVGNRSIFTVSSYQYTMHTRRTHRRDAAESGGDNSSSGVPQLPRPAAAASNTAVGAAPLRSALPQSHGSSQMHRSRSALTPPVKKRKSKCLSTTTPPTARRRVHIMGPYKFHCRGARIMRVMICSPFPATVMGASGANAR